MPQTCRVCAHPKTKEIEDAIVQGTAHTTIADQFGIHFQSVRYHAKNHLSDKLARTVHKDNQEHAEDILSGINDLLKRTNDILNDAESNDQKRLALDAIKESRSIYELLSKIAVKLEEYRRNDEQKKSNFIEEQLMSGLSVLTDNELKMLIYLTGKIHAADPDYEANPSSRIAVDSMHSLMNEYDNFGTSSKPVDIDVQDNTAPEDKNTFKNRTEDLDLQFDDLELDNFDDFDLSTDTIPNEDTDPDWLAKERRRLS